VTMKVLVCIKRVPEVAGRITLTEDARAIDIKYLGFAIGPHEECGVEAAVQLVEQHGGESVVLTLGVEGAIEQLRNAMSIGISRGIHIVTDGEEWDPEATAAAIVDAVKADEADSGPFDLMLFGNEAGDTADYQVAVRVARALGRPAVTGIKGMTIADGVGRCEQEAEGGRDVYEVRLPAVVGVLEGLNLPRYPSVPGRIKARSKPLAVSNPARPASRLEMVRLVVPTTEAKQATILGTGPDAAAAVVAMLESAGVL
jgi:electron transfer flavoprotein beta subunit